MVSRRWGSLLLDHVSEMRPPQQRPCQLRELEREGTAAHRVAIGLGLCREERLHEALLGRLQQGLVLGDHKVSVLGQEVVGFVADRPRIVLHGEARLAQLGLAETLGAGHLCGLVQPVCQVLVRGLQIVI